MKHEKYELFKSLDVVKEKEQDDEDLAPCETPKDYIFNEQIAKSPNNKSKMYTSHGSSMSVSTP